MKTFATLALLAALATAFTGCGDEAATPTQPQPAGNSTMPPVTTTVVTNATVTPETSMTPGASEPTTPAASTSPQPVATATLAADRTFELAPIDGAEMVVRELAPPQYAVHVTSGLPSGCAEFAGATATRTGDEITITVRNTVPVPSDPQIACAQIYGTHETTIELGTAFVSGTHYSVRVNDRIVEFTAQ